MSVKLSALHPRYEHAQRARVMKELYPRLLELAVQAARYDIGLSIDAEEADRLDLSLDLFERVARAPELSGWDGLGLVVQAYGKRALPVLDWLIELAGELRRCVPVRLVKGAYWDAEIKRAQENGMPDFPVYTQKANTDVSYLTCAQRLLAARGAVYPQFATHNAHTVTAVLAMAGGADARRRRRLRVPAPARHGRIVVSRRGAAARVSAGARLRAGRRTSRPARVPRPPAARKRRELEFRQSFPRCGYAGARRGARSGDAGCTGSTPASRDPLTGGVVRRAQGQFGRSGSDRRRSHRESRRARCGHMRCGVSMRGRRRAATPSRRASKSTTPRSATTRSARAHVATTAAVDAAVRAAAAAQPDWNRAGAAARAGVLVALSRSHRTRARAVRVAAGARSRQDDRRRGRRSARSGRLLPLLRANSPRNNSRRRCGCRGRPASRTN